MFARQAEHLIILSDSGLGHLNRVHSLVTSFPKRSSNQSTNQTVFAPTNQSINQLPGDVNRFIGSLVNRKIWPEFPSDLPKQSGYAEFKLHSGKIEDLFFDYVNILTDCLGWFDASIKVLTDISNNLHAISIDQSIDLSNYLLTLIERYTKLHCLIDCLNDPQMYIATYFYSQYLNNQTINPSLNQAVTVPLTSLPETYSKLAQFFSKYGNQSMKHSIKQLQSEHTMLARMIGTTLSSNQSISQTVKLADVKNLTGSKAFLLNQDQMMEICDPSTSQSNQSVYSRIQSINRIRDYVIWSSLLCPDALFVSDALVDTLIDCLINDPIIILHRDQTVNQSINLISLFSDIFDSHSQGSKNLKKCKVSLKNQSANQSISQPNNIYIKHAEMRLYLNQVGEQLYDVLIDVPTAIAPKLAMLFAYLHLARDEVIWYIRNQSINQSIQQAINQSHKHVFPRCLVDDTCSMLMRHVDLITRLIDQNRSSIQSFYLSLIQSFDYPAINQSINQAVNCATIDPLIMQLINHTVDTLDPQSINQSDGQLSVDQSFETIRLNWYRISCGLSMTSSMLSISQSSDSSVTKQSVNQSINQSFNQLINHTRNIDCIDSQLRLHASMHQLFWHKSELETSYEVCLNDDSTDSSGYQPFNQLALMSYVKVMTSSVYNIHRIHPAEQSLIHAQSINQTTRMMKLMVRKLEEQITIIEREMMTMRSLNQSNNQANNQATYQSSNQSINQSKNIVSSICQAIAEFDEQESINQPDRRTVNGLLVANQSISPREFLLDWVFTHLKQRIKQAAFPSHNTTTFSPNQSINHMNPPSTILNLWRDSVFAISIVDRVLSASVSDIALNVLLQEFQSEEDIGVENMDDRPIIQLMGLYYTNLLMNDQLLYSPLHQCFRLSNQSINQSIIDAYELRCLVELIGPSGVRIIFARLMGWIAPKFASIKSIIDDNLANPSINQSINRLRGKFHDVQAVSDALQSLNHMDQFVTLTIQVGLMLSMRLMFLHALNQSINQSGPRFVGLTLENASMIAHQHQKFDASLTVLDLLAADCGIPMGEADHLVRHLLSKANQSINQSNNQSATNNFSLLPEFYALSLGASKWKNAIYSSIDGCHTGNHHCQALAVKHLIVNWNRLFYQSINQSEINQRISDDFQRWLYCSTMVVLTQFQPCTNMLGLSSSKSINQSIIQMRDLSIGRDFTKMINQSTSRDVGGMSAILMYFDHMIAASEGRLTYDQLERFLPFSLIRENLTQLEEKQDVHFSNEELVE